MSKVYLKAKDGWSYEITDEDLLWLGRAAEGEGTREAPHTIWTWMQRYAGGVANLTDFRSYPSLTALVRAHSQPVNPKWARDGEFCRPGGRYAGGPRCAENLLQRRERMSSLPYAQLSLSVRDTILALKTASLPNPVPGAVDFADKPVSENFVARASSRAIGAQVSYKPHGDDGNWFITTTRTRAWPDDYIFLEYHSNCAWVLIGDSQAVGMKPALSSQLGEPSAVFANVGYSTKRTLDEFEGQIRSALGRGPRFVIIVLGGNDAPQSRDMITRYTTQMLELVRSTGVQAVWVGPAHAVDPELQRKKTIVSDIQRVLCAQRGVFWIDGQEMSRDLQHAPDGVHFVRSGSNEWARRIVAAIAPILPTNTTGNLNPLWALTPFGSILALKFGGGQDC